MTSPDQHGATPVNPAALAETLSGTRLVNVDYLVTGPRGERKITPGSHFREEARAVNLGHAAGHVIVGEALADEVRVALSEHAGLEARLEASEPRRRTREHLYAAAANVVVALRALPLNDVDRYRRRSVNAAKVLLIIGDTSVLASQAYRAGAPIYLALALALSLATSVVAIGSKWGHEIETRAQRRRRGPVPNVAAAVVRPFFDDGATNQEVDLWQRLSIAAAIVMFLALFFMGSGSGDPAELAAGYGLLGALTVAGSAGAEAYATNDAAEQREGAERRLSRASEDLKTFEELEHRSAQQHRDAATLETAARHRGVATAATVAEKANRLTDTPDVGGYVDGGHIPVTIAPPTPQTPTVVSEPRRSRARPVYELHSDPLNYVNNASVYSAGAVPLASAPRTPRRRQPAVNSDAPYEAPLNHSANGGGQS